METKRCDFSGEDTDSLSTIIYRVSTSVELMAGMSLNVFIIAVNIADRLRNRGLKPVDQILTALAVSRFFYLCLLMFKLLCMVLIPWVFEFTRLYQMFKAATWFLTCTTLFFSATLCAFYCAKIANFQQRTFILLKTRISQLVPYLLLFSVFASLVNTSPFFYGIYQVACSKQENDSHPSGNGTRLGSANLETNTLNLFLFCSIGFSVAFSFLATLAFLLLFSLWQHTRTCSASFGRPNLEAHFRAVKIILCLLTTEALKFVALILLLSNIFLDRSPQSRFCTSIALGCPTIESGIVIWGNPKLKEAFMATVAHCSLPLPLK
ncbi:taste receptor type 2 member 40-like [Sceloporus undulatus]|uniref:taste receptor type 2 member 40-like n=1 Tax=Sceloporus undulatus TaxID=8520 RepID=UPI001C4B7179|nr:taste receptor type 2 member 40-like [Sceloporus undulatus]